MGSCNPNLVSKEELSGFILLSVESKNLFLHLLLKIKFLSSRNSDVCLNKCLIWIFIFETDQAQISPPPPRFSSADTQTQRDVSWSLPSARGAPLWGRINVPWALNPAWLHSNHHIKMDSACTRTNGPRAYKLRGIIICIDMCGIGSSLGPIGKSSIWTLKNPRDIHYFNKCACCMNLTRNTTIICIFISTRQG